MSNMRKTDYADWYILVCVAPLAAMAFATLLWTPMWKWIATFF